MALCNGNDEMSGSNWEFLLLWRGCNQDCGSHFIIILISLLFWRQEAVLLSSPLEQASYTKTGDLLAPAVITQITVAYFALHHFEVHRSCTKRKNRKKEECLGYFLDVLFGLNKVLHQQGLVLIPHTANLSGATRVKYTKRTVLFSHSLWKAICEISWSDI